MATRERPGIYKEPYADIWYVSAIEDGKHFYLRSDGVWTRDHTDKRTEYPTQWEAERVHRDWLAAQQGEVLDALPDPDTLWSRWEIEIHHDCRRDGWHVTKERSGEVGFERLRGGEWMEAQHDGDLFPTYRAAAIAALAAVGVTVEERDDTIIIKRDHYDRLSREAGDARAHAANYRKLVNAITNALGTADWQAPHTEYNVSAREAIAQVVKELADARAKLAKAEAERLPDLEPAECEAKLVNNVDAGGGMSLEVIDHRHGRLNLNFSGIDFIDLLTGGTVRGRAYQADVPADDQPRVTVEEREVFFPHKHFVGYALLNATNMPHPEAIMAWDHCDDSRFVRNEERQGMTGSVYRVRVLKLID